MSKAVKSEQILINGHSLDDALDKEENMLIRLNYGQQYRDFCLWVYSHRTELADLVAHHIGLQHTHQCHLAESREWICGGFNLCIPVWTTDKETPGKRVLLRLPLPHKIGSTSNPGNAVEKIRSEAATYIWLQQNCPDVPIPFLWGFGIPMGSCFHLVQNSSLITRIWWKIQAMMSGILRRTPPHQYVLSQRRNELAHGYILTDFIERSEGEMLLNTWKEKRKIPQMRTNLYRGLAQIMLSLSSVRQHRVGSWTIDDRGVLSLTNRPLLIHLQALENEGVRTGMPQDRTYTSASMLYSDLLNIHDTRLVMQPNAINDEEDGQAQMACLFTLRGLMPQFSQRELEYGPFFLTLTDPSPGNIFVDEDCNVKYLVDLEWAASLPAAMILPPYWFTSTPIDELEGGRKEELWDAYHDFLKIMEDEEARLSRSDVFKGALSSTMRQALDSNGFFYFKALQNPKAFFNLFRSHLQPSYDVDVDTMAFDKLVSPYWRLDTREVLARKLKDKEQYDKDIKQMFEARPEE